MLRKVPAVLLTAALLTSSVAIGAAAAQGQQAKPQPAKVQVASKITVLLNGKELIFAEEPVSWEGVTYVNASTLALALGGTAAWDSMNKSVLVAKGKDTALRLFADNPVAYKNGKKTKVPAVARPTTGAVLVPLVFVAEELGAKVTLNTKTKTYTITLVEKKQ
ncbi:copper amine oxidase [Bradyrhizobium japonicum]|uniref:Copper amine oxidase n=1 Tax=Bradyrhizobium japonicum TaxID=375 RepID=A0A0A3YGJ3_BRAJP|nr:copper amine oxidase [Bradyrhizobium japonicum]